MSLGDALDLLDSFDLSYALRIVYDNGSSYKARTFASLGNYYRNCWLPCNKIGPFWALTGPPTKRHWRLVYACQFVADILFGEIMKDGKLVYSRIAELVAMGAP